MAESIKGINIVIGAETTGLSKALSDVNKKSSDLQSELRQVERLLKLDPTNTELIAQKQKLLSDAVANTKDKLDQLRAAQEQVNQQFQAGKISEGQYRAFQREIVKTEQALQRLEDQSRETKQSVAEMGQSLQTTADNLTGVGTSMATTITAPIVAGTALIIKGAADAEVAQGKLQASLGLTEKEAKKLSDTAERIWLDGFGENINEANAAVISVRQNMKGLAEDELQEVSQGAMVIADVFNEEVNNVTRTAGVMMKNFKISGKEALDLITVGFQKGGNFSGELLDTLREYSPQFESLGLSADQALAMLIAGAETGAWNLDKVGDAMKEFNLRAQDGSKLTAEGFGMIGLNAKKMGSDIAAGGDSAQKAFIATITSLSAMEDPLKQNQAGVALFGTQWEDVRSQVIFAMQEGITGLDEFEGATQNATEAVKGNNPFSELVKALRGVQEAMGPALLPLAELINDSIAPALKSMSETFAEMSPAGQKTILVIGGLVTALGPLLILIGGMISAFGVIAPAITAAATAIGGFTAPIWIAIGAGAALISLGVALWKNWDEVSAKAKAFGKSVKDGISNMAESVKKNFKELIDSASEWGKNIIDGIVEGFENAKESVVNKAREISQSISKTISNFFLMKSPSRLMMQYGEYIAEGLAIGMENKKGSVAEKAQAMAQAITGAVSKISESISLDVEIAKAKFELFKAMMGETATEGELLKQKLATLDAQLQAQNDKVQVLQKAYADMVKTKGEASAESKKLQLELLKETAAQAALATEIANTNKVQAEKSTTSKSNWGVSDYVFDAAQRLWDSGSAADASKIINDYLKGDSGLGSDAYRAANPDMPDWLGGGKKTDITVNQTIVSPEPLTASSIKQKTEQSLRSLSMEWGLT